MEYLIVAEAYRDLEQASGRLVLIERMAELVTQTPAELLPVVCYLCQGQIAPEFAGVDLGLAEKMAIRALAAARAEGATDLEIHDTVLIAAAFCMMNRYVDGLATIAPEDPAVYAAGAQRLISQGYLPPSAEPGGQA